MNINWDLLHSLPPCRPWEKSLHDCARAESFRFRDFFRASFKSFLPCRLSRRIFDGQKAKGEKKCFSAFFASFRSRFWLSKNIFFLLSLLLSSDGAPIYIKQAPLVIINERMNYCEFNFSCLGFAFIGRFGGEKLGSGRAKSPMRRICFELKRRRINSLDFGAVVSVKWLIAFLLRLSARLARTERTFNLETRYFFCWMKIAT